ncbi:DUF2087 domain-containing protein [Desulfovibrio ferrophilus]|uniref:DUF2087 domain-containing protein n=1 Tax=Desulfovibrio ferrophilus TaxID=241368 RepID=A0A2Z6AVN1_9BACT|nr:DUF2087 domain-containing protein [Desulfovibrio ferrophilus]BBD07309.1 uncharacterized protein DFE_0583 [Desulfovibrio ferrophilus]
MSKSPLPFPVDDISVFAKSLRRQLDGLERAPSHVEMLNLLAKAGGYRNFQHFRAQQDARTNLDVPRPLPADVDYRRVKRLVRFFDAQGRLTRWPKKFTMRMLCLWVMWSRIAAKVPLSEREISDWLDEQHLFGDYALLRRELVDRGLVTRTADGREYRRIERQPSAEAIELLKHLRQ